MEAAVWTTCNTSWADDLPRYWQACMRIAMCAIVDLALVYTQKPLESTMSRLKLLTSMHNTLQLLGLSHPVNSIRDTARYPPLMWAMVPKKERIPRSLQSLALEQLGMVIQSGEHCPVEDATAAMHLYQHHSQVPSHNQAA